MKSQRKRNKEKEDSILFKSRKANESDIPRIKQILDEAREAQRKQGFRQWEDGYPSIAVIASDIECGNGYVLESDGEAAAYAAISFRDSEYDRLEQIWNHHGPYGVIHRIGIADRFRGRHVSYTLFDSCERFISLHGATAVRIDTGVDNKAMQHILASRGYILLGCHNFIWGERLAYEKDLLNAVFDPDTV